MNNQAWTLREAPLDGVLARAAIFAGSAHEEALSRLLFIIEQHRHCGLLFGPPGSGKSLLLQQLTHIVRRAARELAVVDAHGRNAGDMLWELCGELGLGPKYGDNAFVLWRRIQDHLLADHGTGSPAVVILDHADQGGDETDVLIARMVHLARQARGLTLILAVRARNLSEVPHSMREATDIRIELGWLDRQQTAEFIHTLFHLPEDDGPQFDESAIERLHLLTDGSPRMLARLGDLSVLAALANDDLTITEQMVLSAAADLQIIGTPPDRSPVGLSPSYHYGAD